jgi:2'-5' RNA ligase
MSSDGRLPYYSAFRVEDEGTVEKVRDRLWRVLMPDGDDYERVDPHVTVHPGFTCDQQTAMDACAVMNAAIDQELRVDGVSFWPGVDNPAVVKLDVSMPDPGMAAYREGIEAYVEDGGGTIDRDPVDPHITLFKSGDAGEDLEGSLRAPDVMVEKVAASDDYSWETSVAGYTIKKRG